MSNSQCAEQDIAEELLSLIRPYYKGLKSFGQQPEFKKTIRGEEVESLLLSLHDIIVRVKEGGRET